LPGYPTAPTYEDYLEFYNDGRLDPVLARLALTISGDQVTADFTGSNVQVPGVVNNSLAVAGAGVFVALKATLDPGGAVNEGAFRPIMLIAPEGTIFNVALDAPAGAHGEVSKRAVSVALGALAQIMPERCRATSAAAHFPMRSAAGTRAETARTFITSTGGREWRAHRYRRCQRFRQCRFRQPAFDPQCGIDRKRDAVDGSVVRIANRWWRPRQQSRWRRHDPPDQAPPRGGSVFRSQRSRRHPAVGYPRRR
jgi:hypothetical protein